MSRQSQKSGLGWVFWTLFTIILLAAALYTAAYFYLRGELGKGIDDWITSERAAGRTIDYSEKTLGGFPFRYELKLMDPVYANPDTGIAWEGERLDLVMQPWNWRHYIARAPGKNLVTATIDGEPNAFEVTLGRKSAGSYTFNEYGPRRLSIVLDALDYRYNGVPTLTAQNVNLHLRPPSDNPDALQIVASWDEIDLREGVLTDPQLGEVTNMLGTRLQPSRVLIEITEAFPALATNQPLSTWARGDGEATIAQFLFNWGPVKVGAMGDLSLDNKGRLTSTVGIRMDDVPELRTALRDLKSTDPDVIQARDDILGRISLIENGSMNGGFLRIPVIKGDVKLLDQTVATVPPVPVSQ